MVGETICHYRVFEKIGAGGMGVVYRAEDTRLGRQVALKFLPAELAQDRVSLERFQREARAASALNHPGICTIYAIEQQESMTFIAMELLEGETLADRIEHGPLPVEAVLDVAMQIAAALEVAHAKGVVHRDLKPANVFVTTSGQVKILDFGLAKVAIAASAGSTAGRLTSAGMTVGTLSYMSPEQARGEMLDGRTDLFSLGTVIYEMATGALPFEGDTAALTFDAILHGQPPSLQRRNPRLPAELDRIVRKLLEKDRGFRYQTATDVMTDLLRLKRDGSVTSAEKTIAVLISRTSGEPRKTNTCATASPRTSSPSWRRSRAFGSSLARACCRTAMLR
jgi:non-specific serine/threonine protein kinase